MSLTSFIGKIISLLWSSGYIFGTKVYKHSFPTGLDYGVNKS